MARDDGLPFDVPRGPDVGDDPAAAEQRGLRMLAECGAAIVAGVEARVPGWVRDQVARTLDDWSRLDAAGRDRADAEARTAGDAAAIRIASALRALLATDPERQTSTPLQIVRTAYREPTEVLRSAGVPPVVRDEFDERSWPDDRYGLVPRTLGDLGAPELAPLHVAWGVAKATVIRARRARRARESS